MNKRREAFLNKKAHLVRFTKQAIIRHFHITEEEFNELLKKGFLIEDKSYVCVNCYRKRDLEDEECQYCGEEDITTNKGFYVYG